jgi:hypothetical protein
MASGCPGADLVEAPPIAGIDRHRIDQAEAVERIGDSNTRYDLSFTRSQMIDLAPTEQQHYPERTGIHR